MRAARDGLPERDETQSSGKGEEKEEEKEMRNGIRNREIGGERLGLNDNGHSAATGDSQADGQVRLPKKLQL